MESGGFLVVVNTHLSVAADKHRRAGGKTHPAAGTPVKTLTVLYEGWGRFGHAVLIATGQTAFLCSPSRASSTPTSGSRRRLMQLARKADVKPHVAAVASKAGPYAPFCSN